MRFKFGWVGICFYPEGITSHSPGLLAHASYGVRTDTINSTLERTSFSVLRSSFLATMFRIPINHP